MSLFFTNKNTNLFFKTEFLLAAFRNDIQKMTDVIGTYMKTTDKIFNIDYALQGWSATPMGCLAHHGNTESLRYFVDTFGVDLEYASETDCTPLMLAVDADAFDTVEYILSKNVDVNSHRYDMKPALMHARSAKVADLLIEYGAPINFFHERSQRNVVMDTILSGYFETTLTVIGAGADLFRTNTSRMNVMHYAALNKDTPKSLIQLLLINGVPLDEKDTSGHTPLYYALMNGGTENAAYLISMGADLSQIKISKEKLEYIAKDTEDEEIRNFLYELSHQLDTTVDFSDDPFA